MPAENRFYGNDSQIPWNPLRALEYGPFERTGNSSQAGLQAHYSAFDGAVTTDNTTLGRPRSDSGYGTQANQSPIFRLGEPTRGHRNMTNLASLETVQDLMSYSQFDGDQLTNARMLTGFPKCLEKPVPNVEPPGNLGLSAPGNPPYRCQRCENDPEAKKEEYRNKSDWK